MDIVKYRQNMIISIDIDSMVYIDEYDYKKRIDFTECRKNWLDYVQNSGEFPEAELRTLEDSVWVGWRDIMGDPSYIEFFTDQRTRFIFTSRRNLLDILFFRKSRAWVRDFQEVQLRIGRVGWRTFDLS